ncbi:MAG: hypothetical protein SFY96_03200 [Planctomycetota bacterium]|nr:hypothetical protein [Planctomycetota bacterium]
MKATRVRLRALQGEPLADPRIRSTVVAAAEALAERTGVKVLQLDVDNASLTAVLDVDRLGAIGFAAELRRVTSAWYAARHPGEELWGRAAEQDEHADDAE